jgi:hypothetical protein
MHLIFDMHLPVSTPSPRPFFGGVFLPFGYKNTVLFLFLALGRA